MLDIDIDTDSWPSEGQLDVTFPDGTTATETWSADTSFSYASHSGTDVQPVAGEVMLSNGHGATVSLDTSSYHTGTVDDDDDNDGYADADDAFPTDDSEWDDMDGYDASESAVVGLTANVWPGCNCMGLTDRSNLVVRFPPGSTPKQRAALIASLFLVEFAHFEAKRQDNNGGGGGGGA